MYKVFGPIITIPLSWTWHIAHCYKSPLKVKQVFLPIVSGEWCTIQTHDKGSCGPNDYPYLVHDKLHVVTKVH